jgi:hypothetical protein
MELMNYIEPPDIPEGLTIRQWRVQRASATRGSQIRLVRDVRAWIRPAGQRRPTFSRP